MATVFVGVDLGGTNLRCAVMDEQHQILSRVECATEAREGAQAVIGRIAAGITEAMERSNRPQADVAAIGIGVPGPINQEKGLVYSAPNMPGWQNVPLAEIVQKRFNIPAFIENDANCAGWGEFANGAGRGCRHMMMVTLGTGIGGAVIIDGRLHIGRDGTAGELGHVCIEDGGRLCGCGARGCVEAYASANSVVRRFYDLIDEGWDSPLAAGSRKATCHDIFRAAREGDSVAMQVVKRTGHYLGVMAASIAELLNPERCVISGGMIQAGDMLFPAIRTTCLNRNDHPGRTMEILPAELGPNAGLIGAADQARLRLDGKRTGNASKSH